MSELFSKAKKQKVDDAHPNRQLADMLIGKQDGFFIYGCVAETNPNCHCTPNFKS
jgi:hypothetical protein